MASERRKLAYTALENRFEAEQAEGLHNLLVYFENPAGIGEHPELQEEMRTQLLKVANAEDALNCLKKHAALLMG